MMQINSNTRISDLIKHDKNSIDALASLAKPLEKLKNPILRKIMASRVTIAEAAKMSGCEPEDFARVLQPLGFHFSKNGLQADSENVERPAWLHSLAPDRVQQLDVRTDLASGKDPLKLIIQRFKTIEAGHALCIINSFIPIPLVRLLEKDGVRTYTQTLHPDEFHTYFLKPTLPQAPQKASPSVNRVFMDRPEDFWELQPQFAKQNTKEIDVRHLEMPLPMQSILQELAVLAKNAALFVHHKRVPLYLLEELADQDFEVHVLKLEDNDVKLFIFHLKTP